MSRWIRGRLGRPIAGIISLLMLGTILLPMASTPAKAQSEDSLSSPSMNIGSLLENLDDTVTAPIAVLDFYNRSGYKSGVVSQEAADSLALALAGTGKYSVIERSQVDEVLRDTNFTVPLSYEAQAMIADRLNVPYVVSGEIEGVSIQRTREGVFAEVVLNCLVISRITRRPINGARVTTKSSPKLGYVTSNMDPLVQEALFIGASLMTNRIIDHQTPVATVLNPSAENVVRVRGGSVIGFRPGMRLVSIRQGTVSGILQIESVSAIESICRVVENIRGVAPSDKVVPFYSNDPEVNTPSNKLKNSMGALLPYAALGVLGLFLSHSTSSAASSALSVSAAPIADPQYLGNAGAGATKITWKKGNNQVLNYIVYRVTSNDTTAIAVVNGNQNYYIDAGYMPTKTFGSTTEGDVVIEKRFANLRTFTLEIDPALAGPQVLQQDYTEITPTYWNYTYNITDPTLSAEDDPPTFTPTLTISPTEITVACMDMPLYPGESASYAVRPIYYTWEATTSDNENGVDYSLKYGEISPITPMVTMTAVPLLLSDSSTDPLISGEFACVTPEYRADKYAFQGGNAIGILQLSGDPLFNTAATFVVPANMTVLQLNDPVVQELRNQTALVAIYNILETTEPILQNIPTIYYRMGVRYPTNPASVPLQASANSSYNGYVFSETKSLNLNRSMLIRSLNAPGQGPVNPLKSGSGRPSRTRHLK